MVTDWPFAGSFLPRYISGMAVGEGMSGVVAALLSRLQYLTCTNEACTDFSFGPSQYFAALALAVGCSAVAFWCLEHLRGCKAQRNPQETGAGNRSLELLVAGDELSETQLLSPGGTELYGEGDDGLRGSPRAEAHVGGYYDPRLGIGESERAAMLFVVGWCSCWQNGVV